jgi:hypothetical protein
MEKRALNRRQLEHGLRRRCGSESEDVVDSVSRE